MTGWCDVARHKALLLAHGWHFPITACPVVFYLSDATQTFSNMNKILLMQQWHLCFNLVGVFAKLFLIWTIFRLTRQKWMHLVMFPRNLKALSSEHFPPLLESLHLQLCVLLSDWLTKCGHSRHSSINAKETTPHKIFHRSNTFVQICLCRVSDTQVPVSAVPIKTPQHP